MEIAVKIVLLGWGSLIWDLRKAFDEKHDDWLDDGPSLKLEFSRVSQTRNDALTLVLDLENGAPCQVAYALSKRNNTDDAICDLRSREGTTLKNIGFCFVDKPGKRCRDEETLQVIRSWASNKKIDVVVWTDLENNFLEKSKCKKSFSKEAALCHIQDLDPEGKSKAAEYVFRAPSFIKTPLREALQTEPWFKKKMDGLGC